MKAQALQRLLEREPLGYYVVRRHGSHKVMRASGRGQILFAYHDGATVPPRAVAKILMTDVGLSEEEVWDLLA
jgi:predicted RNA binding protein YcfA (HicA-like mRNA interferase family)